MRVTKEQAAAHRDRVLRTAGRLFRQRGFDGVGIADIMKHAGLTHGGFYGHFASKDALSEAMTRRVLANNDWPETLTGRDHPTFSAIVRSYLGPPHVDHPERGCLFAALAGDVARQPPAVRRAFTDGLRRRVETLRTFLPRRAAAAQRRRALAAMSSLVGALVLARAVDDEEFSREILDATAAALVQREARIQ